MQQNWTQRLSSTNLAKSMAISNRITKAITPKFNTNLLYLYGNIKKSKKNLDNPNSD